MAVAQSLPARARHEGEEGEPQRAAEPAGIDAGLQQVGVHVLDLGLGLGQRALVSRELDLARVAEGRVSRLELPRARAEEPVGLHHRRYGGPQELAHRDAPGVAGRVFRGARGGGELRMGDDAAAEEEQRAGGADEQREPPRIGQRDEEQREHEREARGTGEHRCDADVERVEARGEGSDPAPEALVAQREPHAHGGSEQRDFRGRAAVSKAAGELAVAVEQRRNDREHREQHEPARERRESRST